MKAIPSRFLLAVALVLTLLQTAEAGRLRRLLYQNYNSATIADLYTTNTLGVPTFPNSPDAVDYLPAENGGPSSLIPPYLADTGPGAQDLYGSLIEGYVTAPETGAYTFYIASDDESLFFLNSDSSDP